MIETPQDAWSARCAAAETREARAAVWREQQARWREVQAGLGLLDGIRALHAASEISAEHKAMLERAVG